MKPEQPVEPMHQVCPNIVVQFSGPPSATCWGAAASVDFNFNRAKPSYRWIAVKTEAQSMDSVIIRSKLNESSPVEVKVISKWDASTKTVTGKVVANFDTAVPQADYRIGLLVVEDSITGPIPNYRQYSDFNSPYDDKYVFPDVVRGEILANDFWGKAGVIPNQPVVGKGYETPFTYTLPAKYYDIAPRAHKIHLIAFVTKKPTMPISACAEQVLNCSKSELTQSDPTAISKLSQRSSAPNVQAISHNGQLHLTVVQEGSYQIGVYALNGKAVHRSQQWITATSSSVETKLSAGTYIVQVEGVSGSIVQKISIQ